MVRAGEMDERLELQRKVQTPDGAGGLNTTWETFRYLWARVRPLNGKQAVEDMQRQSPVQFEVKVRYEADVDPSLIPQRRLLRHGRPLNISHGICIGRRDTVHLYASSEVDT
jgi:SPP1 family predicted phage head-tail adaptor